ncbi:MAG: hypothetical protein JXQ69_01120 [Paludibacteraceae bacterium]|nr:hypothetical protein [Paludibacteraceae bacterium]MBN2786899.1 hypothetical protein [Paludibacteraceae bacterium]
MVTFGTQKHHWNYFLAIENDLDKLSRYIEFSNENLLTYSIELTHILLSASSEVDVIMKQLCSLIAPSEHANNINDYKLIIQNNIPSLINEEITIDRFGLSFKPWINWEGTQNPDWWGSYNNVKHERNTHFNDANLQNTINAVGALLITVVYYYKYAFSKEKKQEVSFKDTTYQLKPGASLMSINSKEYYHFHLVL